MRAALLVGASLLVVAGAVYFATRHEAAKAPPSRGRGYKGDVTNPKKYAGDVQTAATAYASYQSGGITGAAARYAPEIGHALGIT